MAADRQAQAFLTAIGLLALTIWAAIYLPRAVATASADFGILGVGFTLLSLLFSASLVLVVTAAVGATLAETPPAGGGRDHPQRVSAAHPPRS